MHLSTAPRLAAEVSGCAQEQLDRLARSVEARRQQLEEDINAYIARKQDELRRYESELVEQLCSLPMEKDRADDEDFEAASLSSRRSSASAASDSTSTERTESVASPSPSLSHQQHFHHAKQKKHGRVHKREKELYGLVTPVFLPLLDARETTSPEKSNSHSHNYTSNTKPASLPTDTSSSSTTTPPPSEPATPTSNAPQSPSTLSPKSNPTAGAMPGEPTTSPAPVLKERSASDPGKKSRRSSIKKKSALRHNSSTPRSRKRVSLVIDDQVVLPSDVIQEPTLVSPAGSETTSSATTSTASLDDVIDPRLTADNDGPMYIEHTETVHHSLPPSIPVLSEKDHSPPTPDPRSPTTTAFAPPSYATRTFLDPPVSERIHIEETAGPGPIYPDVDDKEDQVASSLAAVTGPVDDTEHFETYVGGISGSGVADVNQVGSVGYPSSLGASYLESYMQGRPLSVRMAAAEREGDEGEIRRLRGLEERRKIKEREAAKAKEKVVEEDEEEWDKPAGKGQAGGDDDDGFMGSMDDF